MARHSQGFLASALNDIGSFFKPYSSYKGKHYNGRSRSGALLSGGMVVPNAKRPPAAWKRGSVRTRAQMAERWGGHSGMRSNAYGKKSGMLRAWL